MNTAWDRLSLGFFFGGALLAASTVSAQSVEYDRMASTGGKLGVSFDASAMKALGLRGESSGRMSAFEIGQPLELTFVSNVPHRLQGGMLEFFSDAQLGVDGGASITLGALQLMATGDPQSSYDFSIYSADSGRRLFYVTGSAFTYDAASQTLTLETGALRATDVLAGLLNRPAIADEAIGRLLLSAGMSAVETTVMDLPTLEVINAVPPVQPNNPPIGDRAAPDVTLAGIETTSNFGTGAGPTGIGTVRAYAIGSNTCNIGTANLEWTDNASPGLAMNMFRLHNGRLLQIGQGWVKTACCAAAGSGCGMSCNGVGGNQLGSGCLDVYSSGWNGIQSRLQKRSAINAFTGSFTGAIPSGTVTSVDRRTQVRVDDMSSTLFPGALYFVEGIYASAGDASGSNWLNNATHRRVTVSATGDLTLQTGNQQYKSAIFAWRANGGGVGVADTRVEDDVLDLPGEGRFHVATKVTDLGNGQWLYDFAFYNVNSDRSAGGVTVPTGLGMTVQGSGFYAPFSHSGEVYSNAAWTFTNNGSNVNWATESYATNQNANAIRWGTMYNFWFTANRPPVRRTVNVDLFKPGTLANVTIALRSPAAPGDLNLDGQVNLTDLASLLAVFGCSGACPADLNNDGATDLTDLAVLLSNFGA